MIISVDLGVQDYVEVTCVNSGFLYTADFGLEALHGQACKYFSQYFLICAQVQKGCYCHIPADSGIAFQI